MTQPRFIHLRVHTEYSLLEGAVPVKKLINMCDAANMPAVAVTDTNALFSALEFSVLAKGAGLQPIIGCQVSVAYDPAQPGEKPPGSVTSWLRPIRSSRPGKGRNSPKGTRWTLS